MYYFYFDASGLVKRYTQNELILIASDQRILRAAQIQGLFCFNPETDSQQVLTNWVWVTTVV